jgi:hypothetical protein
MDVQRRAATMARIFAASLPIFVLVYVLVMRLQPLGSGDALPWVDLGIGLLAYGAAVFGGILQLYNLAERGFSLRILIDIGEAADECMTLPEVAQRYSGGRGIAWMYQKRIEDAIAQRLVRVDGDGVELLDKGRLLARMCTWFRALYALDEKVADAGQ